MEILLLVAIAYAGVRGVESIAGDFKTRYNSKIAEGAVRKVAASGGKAPKNPGPTDPGGTFDSRRAAPRTASLGTRIAAVSATGVVTGATYWRSFRDGYQQALPTAREEARRRMIERAEGRKAGKRAAEADAEPASIPLVDPIDEAIAVGNSGKRPAEAPPAVLMPPVSAPGPAPTPESPAEPEDKPGLSLVKTAPDPDSTPDLIGDIDVIPEVRTLDGLINALGIVKGQCLMRAEEATAVASDDAEISGRLDAIAAELAGLEVDETTLGDIEALREKVAAQSSAAAAYGTAAANAADLASASADAAHKSHGGIAEAVQSSPIPQAAQAGYYER